MLRMSFTELSLVHILKQTSPRSTLLLAKTSPKAANIHNRW